MNYILKYIKMMNNSYNINYSKIIFENGKLIEPSLDEKIL